MDLLQKVKVSKWRLRFMFQRQRLGHSTHISVPVSRQTGVSLSDLACISPALTRQFKCDTSSLRGREWFTVSVLLFDKRPRSDLTHRKYTHGTIWDVVGLRGTSEGKWRPKKHNLRVKENYFSCPKFHIFSVAKQHHVTLKKTIYKVLYLYSISLLLL